MTPADVDALTATLWQSAGVTAGAGLRRRRVPAPGQHRSHRPHPDAGRGGALPGRQVARQAGAPGRSAAGQPRVRRALGRRVAGSLRRARVPQAGPGEAARPARVLPGGVSREPALRPHGARDADLLGRDLAERPRRLRRVARQGRRRRDHGVGDGAPVPGRADPVRAVPRPPVRRSLQAGRLLRVRGVLRAHQDQAGEDRGAVGSRRRRQAMLPRWPRPRRRRRPRQPRRPTMAAADGMGGETGGADMAALERAATRTTRSTPSSTSPTGR